MCDHFHTKIIKKGDPSKFKKICISCGLQSAWKSSDQKAEENFKQKAKETKMDNSIYKVKIEGMKNKLVDDSLKVRENIIKAIESSGNYEVIGTGTDLRTWVMDISFIDCDPKIYDTIS